MRALLLFLFITLSVQALEVEHLNGVAQDSAGFMYFSSHDGVYRYDGEHTLNISKYTGLPKGITKDIEISSNDTAFVLYSNGEIWSINLNLMEGEFFIKSKAIKIDVQGNRLFTLTKTDLIEYDIPTKSLKSLLLNKDRIIDFDSGHGNAFALANDGLYQIGENRIKQLVDLNVHKGEVLSTPHGAVFVANKGISF